MLRIFGKTEEILCPDPDKFGGFIEIGRVQIQSPNALGRFVMRLSHRLKLWRPFVLARFLVTGDCGLNCGVAAFRKLDGTPFQQFVPEADCPIHDRWRKSSE